MLIMQKIRPCLWFDDQAEQAVAFYTAIFKNSSIVNIARYGEAGHEVHGKAAGTVMAIAFELDGQAFSALNGGPVFKFNEAISLQVNCETQQYGVSWQIIPVVLFEMLTDPDYEKSQRAMQAMLQMKKLDIDKLKRAYAG